MFQDELQMLLEYLTKDKIVVHINDMIEMSRQLEGDYWTMDHYLSELKKKWELSFGVFQDGQLIAFMIVSDKGINHHLHRIVVNKSFQNRQIGKLMMLQLIYNARMEQKHFVTLKVHEINSHAIAFYKKLGFFEIEYSSPNYLYQLDMQL